MGVFLRARYPCFVMTLRAFWESDQLNYLPRPKFEPRGGLVFKAHRLVYHSTLGLRVIKKKKEEPGRPRFEPTIDHARWRHILSSDGNVCGLMVYINYTCTYTYTYPHIYIYMYMYMYKYKYE